MRVTRWMVAVVVGAGLSGIAAGWGLKNGPLQSAAAFRISADGKLVLIDGNGWLRVKDATTGQDRQKVIIPAASKARFKGVRLVKDDTAEVYGWKKVGRQDVSYRWTWNTGTGAINGMPAKTYVFDADSATNGNLVAVPARSDSFNLYPATLQDKDTGRKIRDLQNLNLINRSL